MNNHQSSRKHDISAHARKVEAYSDVDRASVVFLVFTRFWHFFSAFHGGYAGNSIHLTWFFPGISHDTSTVWHLCNTVNNSAMDKNVRSCGSGYRLRSSEISADSLSAGFLL